MLLTVFGLVVGLIVSLMATPVLQSMLINLPATDPRHVCRRLGSAHRDRARGLLCARATRIDPIATLRAE